MKVRVYNEKGGAQSILIEPSRGRHLAPVLLKGVTPGALKEEVLAVVERLRRPQVSRD